MKIKIAFLILTIVGLLFSAPPAPVKIGVTVPSFLVGDSFHPNFSVSFIGNPNATGQFYGSTVMQGSNYFTNTYIYDALALNITWTGYVIVKSITPGFKVDRPDTVAWKISSIPSFTVSDTGVPTLTITSVTSADSPTLRTGNSVKISYVVSDNSRLIKIKSFRISYDNATTWYLLDSVSTLDTAYGSFSAKIKIFKATIVSNSCFVKMTIGDASNNFVTQTSARFIVLDTLVTAVCLPGKAQFAPIHKAACFYDLQGRQIAGRKISGLYVQVSESKIFLKK